MSFLSGTVEAMFKKWFSRSTASSQPTSEPITNQPTSNEPPASQPTNEPIKNEPTKLTWSSQATQALDMALKQAPVPKLLKGKLRKELISAAEAHATQAGHSEVTAEDLVNGLMAKIPENMRGQVEAMINQRMNKMNQPKHSSR